MVTSYRKHGGMKKYKLAISPNEYHRFHTHPSTRLFLHSYNGNELTVETSNYASLAKSLEGVIDSGAVSFHFLLKEQFKKKA